MKQEAEVHCVTLTFRMAQLLLSTETKGFICLGVWLPFYYYHY